MGRKIDRYDVQLKNPRVPPTELKKIRDLRERGMTYKQIAYEVGWSMSVVFYHLTK